MDEQLSPVAVTHLLQHTLRSLCTGDAPPWAYAVFWRVLPRNYPPPKWDLPGAAYDRTRGNRRNWILAWEDGFCNFAATTSAACGQAEAAYGGDCEAAAAQQQHEEAAKQPPGLQPELFFKMSHDIYNYGEGLIGKVAADHSHKWVFKEPPQHETASLISSWTNPADSHPRTWEAQFQSGIQTIALIAVREGVVQLGSMKKVAEDLSYVVMLRRKFGYLENIPGVLLPHPSSAGAFPGAGGAPMDVVAGWPPGCLVPPGPPLELYDPYGGAVPVVPAPAAPAAAPPMHIMPSMSSLEALLSKLPSVVPAHTPPPPPGAAAPAAAKAEEETPDGYVHCHGAMDAASNGGGGGGGGGGGECTSTSASTAATAPVPSYFVDVGSKPSEGF